MASVRALALIVALRSAAAWIGPRKSKFNNGLRKSPHLSGTATVADADESKLALSYFLDDEDAIIKPTSGGVNNIVQYVETSKGKNYILRIYNNGCDTPRVKFEHSVLEQLDINGAAKALPFQLPRFSKAKADGSTMAELPSGTMSCVCQTIPGGLPKTADPRPLGRAAGQLLIELGKIDPSKLEGESCHPYADIYAAHPKVSKDLFYEYIKGPELDSCRDAINDLQAEFSNLDIFIEDYRQKGIPQQIVHGDLHYDNVLCDEESGEVTGLLDFEFCAMDWRAMELAVCLSKYVSEPEPLPLVQAFIAGFAESGLSLTPDECAGLPEMINLRVMSNCVYFVGRAIAGEDSIESLTSRAAMYADRVKWVRENRGLIVDAIIAASK